MSKEDLIELQGVVTEVLAGGNYKVKCGENHEVLARLNGKMRQFRIRVIAGRPRDRRRLALRPQARPHHLPRQVAALRGLPKRPTPTGLAIPRTGKPLDSPVADARAAVPVAGLPAQPDPRRHPSAASWARSGWAPASPSAPTAC